MQYVLHVHDIDRTETKTLWPIQIDRLKPKPKRESNISFYKLKTYIVTFYTHKNYILGNIDVAVLGH